MRAHRRRGHTIAVVSSATRYQIEPLARDLGIEHVLCTRLEVTDGRFTGGVVDAAVLRRGQARRGARARRRRAASISRESYFYTDSDEDLPLLELVGRPRPTNPNRSLATIARAARLAGADVPHARHCPALMDVVRTSLAVGEPRCRRCCSALPAGVARRGAGARWSTSPPPRGASSARRSPASTCGDRRGAPVVAPARRSSSSTTRAPSTCCCSASCCAATSSASASRRCGATRSSARSSRSPARSSSTAPTARRRSRRCSRRSTRSARACRSRSRPRARAAARRTLGRFKKGAFHIAHGGRRADRADRLPQRARRAAQARHHRATRDGRRRRASADRHRRAGRLDTLESRDRGDRAALPRHPAEHGQADLPLPSAARPDARRSTPSGCSAATCRSRCVTIRRCVATSSTWSSRSGRAWRRSTASASCRSTPSPTSSIGSTTRPEGRAAIEARRRRLPRRRRRVRDHAARAARRSPSSAPPARARPASRSSCPVRRRADLSREAFVDHWFGTHVPLARAHHPGLTRYVTNVVERRLGDDGRAVGRLHRAALPIRRRRSPEDSSTPRRASASCATTSGSSSPTPASTGWPSTFTGFRTDSN